MDFWNITSEDVNWITQTAVTCFHGDGPKFSSPIRAVTLKVLFTE